MGEQWKEQRKAQGSLEQNEHLFWYRASIVTERYPYDAVHFRQPLPLDTAFELRDGTFYYKVLPVPMVADVGVAVDPARWEPADEARCKDLERAEVARVLSAQPELQGALHRSLTAVLSRSSTVSA